MLKNKSAVLIGGVVLCALSVIFILLSPVAAIGQTAQRPDDLDQDGVADKKLQTEKDRRLDLVPPSVAPGRLLIDGSHSGFFDVSGFTDHLASMGWEVVVLEQGPVTEQALADYDIFMSAYRLDDFEVAEVTAVENYLRSGGGLWVLNDYNWGADAANSLSQRFGVTFNGDEVADPTDRRGMYVWVNVHMLAEHPVTDGVGSFGYYAGCSLNVTAPAVVIASGDDDSYCTYYSSYPPLMAAARVGRGRVVFSGDRTPLHSNYYAEKLDAEEQLLLMNIAEWLSSGGDEPAVVAVDVKPGSCPNPLNVPVFDKSDKRAKPPNKGVLPVAVLGDADFDVYEVDVSSLRLSGVEPLRYQFEDVGAPPGNGDNTECKCAEEGPDGVIDLALKFRKSEIAGAIGTVSVGDVVPLTLSGNLLDGTPIEGTDCVTVVGGPVPDCGPIADDGATSSRAVPNPFNPITTIRYTVTEDQFVRLSIYDVSGRRVETLVDEVQSAGEHIAVWDATGAASGIYYFRIEGTGFHETGRLVLLK